eukprot:gnl/TRDRNA2_/TRDRNA2_201625_c0_seq1.p1 gnl/TRDRNA2_/TRDRNA2_201625_c0~~gnl/TRDRNA2_/TRDRNA2_201625_c0_seq1.p1  ORF type:complete len:343 (+),score=45.45 gnl/TRDRNA2_/TRDRNA2_201625_c0_seq1:154-1182(+)
MQTGGADGTPGCYHIFCRHRREAPSRGYNADFLRVATRLEEGATARTAMSSDSPLMHLDMEPTRESPKHRCGKDQDSCYAFLICPLYRLVRSWEEVCQIFAESVGSKYRTHSPPWSAAGGHCGGPSGVAAPERSSPYFTPPSTWLARELLLQTDDVEVGDGASTVSTNPPSPPSLSSSERTRSDFASERTSTEAEEAVEARGAPTPPPKLQQSRSSRRGMVWLLQSPGEKVRALNLPNSVEIAQMLRGQPNLEEGMVERAQRIARQGGHVAGAKVLFGRKRGRRRNGRSRLMPMTAVPWVLLVPACLACQSTRTLLLLAIVTHFVWALMVTLASKCADVNES